MNISGNCVVCAKHLSETNYRRQEVVAAIGPEGTVVICAAHLLPGPGTPEYERGLKLAAEAKARQVTIAAKAKRLHVEPDMLTPDSKTCGDCRHWPRCSALISDLNPKNEFCDFAPSRFT